MPTPVERRSSAELEREVLESETIEGDEEPDELLHRMTQTLAIEAGDAHGDQTDPGEPIEGSERTLATRISSPDSPAAPHAEASGPQPTAI